ncbi:hypothetical protein SH528x_002143 [Novipirellula sp. SH528]|uniref:hypothetical protein n=1 Tax=Novipirellula sp. SH528 TaxID=3454466 RepID=UPI003FA0F808
MSNLKHRLDVHPARLVRADDGTSAFGGDVRHEGAHPKHWKQPLHLVAMLDARSADFPLGNYPHDALPLYYPFASDFPSLQYRIESDSAIQIVNVSRYQTSKRPMIETTFLPQFRANLVAFTYDEARAIAVSETYPSYESSATDRELLDATDAFSSVRTGANLRTFQGDVDNECHNLDCLYHGKSCRIDIFCIAPCSRALAPNSHWGTYSSDVDLVFGTCRFCDTIVARSVST